MCCLNGTKNMWMALFFFWKCKFSSNQNCRLTVRIINGMQVIITPHKTDFCRRRPLYYVLTGGHNITKVKECVVDREHKILEEIDDYVIKKNVGIMLVEISYFTYFDKLELAFFVKYCDKYQYFV